jgi:predicted phosphatase
MTCLVEERMWKPPEDKAPAGLTSRNCCLAGPLLLLLGWNMVGPPARELTFAQNRIIFHKNVLKDFPFKTNTLIKICTNWEKTSSYIPTPR